MAVRARRAIITTGERKGGVVARLYKQRLLQEAPTDLYGIVELLS